MCFCAYTTLYNPAPSPYEWWWPIIIIWASCCAPNIITLRLPSSLLRFQPAANRNYPHILPYQITHICTKVSEPFVWGEFRLQQSSMTNPYMKTWLWLCVNMCAFRSIEHQQNGEKKTRYSFEFKSMDMIERVCRQLLFARCWFYGMVFVLNNCHI